MRRIWHFILICKVCASAICFSSCSGYEPANLPPAVNLNDASSITRTSATLSGSIIPNKDGAVTDIQMRWGKNPQNMGNCINFSPQNLNPQTEINNLTANTTYHFQLLAGNEYTKIESQIKSFTTLPNTRPVLENLRILYCGIFSSTVACRITDNGGETITEAGIRYWENDKDTLVAKVVMEGEEEFIFSLMNLSPNTQYNIQAYAGHTAGTGYSNTIQIVTGKPNVIVEKPGTLPQIIDNSDAFEIEELRISGTLNGDDIKYLRHMSSVRKLDLSESTITAGGSSYDGSHYTSNNIISTGMFAGHQNLEEIILPVTATKMEENAFTDCTSLKVITIPGNLSEMGHSFGCTSLSHINVTEQNTYFCSNNGILYNKECTKLLWYPIACSTSVQSILSSVTILGEYSLSEYPNPTIVLPDNLKEIEKLAFYNTMLEDISLPRDISTIPYALFQNSGKLKSARLGEKTDYISDYVFSGTPLEKLTIEADTFVPYCTSNAFTGLDTSKCTLYVKKASVKLYRNSKFGEIFRNIETIAD